MLTNSLRSSTQNFQDLLLFEIYMKQVLTMILITGFPIKNCFFKEMGPLIFLSRVKFSRETVSDLFYLLKIDYLTFLKVLFFVKC